MQANTELSLELLTRDGRRRSATVRLFSTPLECQLEFTCDAVGVYQFRDRDYLGCLEQLRALIEPRGCCILCNGARRNFHASGMARDMSAGLRGYLLPLADDATRPPFLVDTFEPADPADVCTAAEQKAWYESWTRSRGDATRL